MAGERRKSELGFSGADLVNGVETDEKNRFLSGVSTQQQRRCTTHLDIGEPHDPSQIVYHADPGYRTRMKPRQRFARLCLEQTRWSDCVLLTESRVFDH